MYTSTSQASHPAPPCATRGVTGYNLIKGPYVSRPPRNTTSRGPASARADALTYESHRRTVVGPIDRSASTPGAERYAHHPASGGQVLELANLEVVYNKVILSLRGLSIEVPDGQIVALLGANGAGKRPRCGP